MKTQKMKTTVFSLLGSALFASTMILNTASAQEATPASPWTHESEASVVKVGGNTSSDSYSAKQKTAYKSGANTYLASARYLRTKAADKETAKQWDASLKYERQLAAHWSVFAQHGAESDPYSSYLQRDNSDIGGKYEFIKSDSESLFTEAGLRYIKTISAVASSTTYNMAGRLYTEYVRKLNSSVTGKVWVEYLPNFKDSDAYLLNYEPSLSVMLNQIFSLKVAYLVKYHNKVTTATEKKEDTTFTTALVAKF